MDNQVFFKELSEKLISQIIQFETENAPDSPYYGRYDKEGFLYIFKNPSTCKAYGLYLGSELIGWGSFRSKNEEDFEISSIVISKNQRRHGYGARFLHYLVDRILESQLYKKIFLTVYPLNLPAIFLYLKNNFVIYDFKKNVYGEGADRVYMRYEKL
jgi:ribosomal protein S18 acetylase RimI-like enzyme